MILLAILLGCQCKCDSDPTLCMDGPALTDADDAVIADLQGLEGRWVMVDCDGVEHVVEVPVIAVDSFTFVESSSDEVDACEGDTVRGDVTVTYDDEARTFEAYDGSAGYGLRGSLGEGAGYLTLHADGSGTLDVMRNDCAYSDVAKES